MKWTIIDIINWGKEYFKGKGIESPRLNIELILSDILNYTRIELYTNYNQPLNDAELLKIKNFVIRRGKHEPLQYILGKTYFYGYQIIVNSDVMVPRPETEELVNLFIHSFPDKSEKLDILDIGTGSGCIAIALANEFKNSKITAIDISEEALVTARVNINHHSIENILLRKLNIFDCDLRSYRFDVIISNPPYIAEQEFIFLQPEVKEYEPKLGLSDGFDGLTFFRFFSEVFYDILNPGGKFFLEFGMGQSDYINNFFNNDRYQCEIEKDSAGTPRFLSGRTTRGK